MDWIERGVIYDKKAFYKALNVTWNTEKQGRGNSRAL